MSFICTYICVTKSLNCNVCFFVTKNLSFFVPGPRNDKFLVVFSFRLLILLVIYLALILLCYQFIRKRTTEIFHVQLLFHPKLLIFFSFFSLKILHSFFLLKLRPQLFLRSCCSFFSTFLFLFILFVFFLIYLN